VSSWLAPQKFKSQTAIQPKLRAPYVFAGAGCARPFFRFPHEGMERREALSACEAPLADLAIDPPEHRAKAFAHLAIGALKCCSK
jgi:hypothetical protein